MTLVTGTLPYDLENLLGGAARVVISDDGEATLPAIPAKLQDAIDCEYPYEPKTGWIDIGATADGSSYRREISSSGYEIQQVKGTIFEEITDVARQLSVAMAEFRPEFIRMLEEAPAITTIAAATGGVAQKGIKVGTITQLTSRRVMFIGQRNKDSGVVTESVGARTRGRFVAYCMYVAQIAGDAVEITAAKGALASAPLTFNSLPEASQPQGEEYGQWFLEDSGIIA